MLTFLARMEPALSVAKPACIRKISAAAQPPHHTRMKTSVRAGVRTMRAAAEGLRSECGGVAAGAAGRSRQASRDLPT